VDDPYFYFRYPTTVITKLRVTPQEWANGEIVEIKEINIKDESLQDQSFVRSVNFVMLCFSLSDEGSFQTISKINRLDTVKKYTFFSRIPKFLLGLKSDASPQVVTEGQIQALLKELNSTEDSDSGDNAFWKYFKVSAKEGTDVYDFLKSLQESFENGQ